MSWTVIVIIVCLLLSILMLWQEYRRPKKSRLSLRLLANLLSAIALACIALPISYNSSTTVTNNSMVLLTKGFDKDSLSRYQGFKLLTTEADIQKAYPKLNLSYLPDISDIRNGGFKNIHIAGYGLNDDELEQLGKIPIAFHPAQMQPGIININWTKNIQAGESLQIEGRFTGMQSPSTIALKGLNTTFDSVKFAPNTNSKNQSSKAVTPNYGETLNFHLSNIPKNTGRATYTLLVISGKDTIEKETIPFEVEAAKPIKVLMLATSPGFENRFLKNWLSQHGYGVSVRTTISKEKLSREYFNMDQLPLDHITPALLDKFDLVIGDLSAFKSLSMSENGVLQQQMAQKGLGVIVKADSTDKGTSFLSNTFQLDRLADKNQKALPLLINGQNQPTAKLTLDAVFIKPQANSQTLVSDAQNHTVAASNIYGSGKIVFTTLSNTFNWALSGNQADYTSLWSALINKAIRKSAPTQKWNTTLLPSVNNPVIISLSGPVILPSAVKAGTSMLAFAQSPLLPFSWTATYWPKTYGWQQVTQNNLPVYWWYAFKANDWQNLHNAEKTNATLKYASQNKPLNNSTNSEHLTVQKQVSKIWFYMLLLLCCTYLWVERKL